MAQREQNPVHMGLDSPLAIARWRALFQGILAIPHIFILYFLGLGLSILTFIAFWSILFTAKIPRGMFDFMVTIHRYQWRVTSYVLFMRAAYPPFDFTAASEDPGGDPATLSIDYPERLSRLLPFVKWLLAIPNLIVLLFVGIALYVVLVIGWLAVIITGSWPAGLRRFVVGAARWALRVQVYTYLMTDQYPPFSLE
jgi:hypothetical protein